MAVAVVVVDADAAAGAAAAHGLGVGSVEKDKEIEVLRSSSLSSGPQPITIQHLKQVRQGHTHCHLVPIRTHSRQKNQQCEHSYYLRCHLYW